MTGRVLVTVADGMTEIYIDGDVEVLTVDYDIDGLTNEEVIHDFDGEKCVIRWEVTVDPALVKQAFDHFDAAV